MSDFASRERTKHEVDNEPRAKRRKGTNASLDLSVLKTSGRSSETSVYDDPEIAVAKQIAMSYIVAAHSYQCDCSARTEPDVQAPEASSEQNVALDQHMRAKELPRPGNPMPSSRSNYRVDCLNGDVTVDTKLDASLSFHASGLVPHNDSLGNIVFSYKSDRRIGSHDQLVSSAPTTGDLELELPATGQKRNATSMSAMNTTGMNNSKKPQSPPVYSGEIRTYGKQKTAPPADIFLDGLELTMPELAILLPNSLNNYQAIHRATSNDWKAREICEVHNWAFATASDKTKSFERSTLIKKWQRVMEKTFGISKPQRWLASKHIRTPISDLSTAQWAASDDANDKGQKVRLSDLGKGVLNWPPENMGLNLFRAVRYSVEHPEEPLYFPRDVLPLCARLPGGVLTAGLDGDVMNHDQMSAAWWHEKSKAMGAGERTKKKRSYEDGEDSESQRPNKLLKQTDGSGLSGGLSGQAFSGFNANLLYNHSLIGVQGLANDSKDANTLAAHVPQRQWLSNPLKQTSNNDFPSGSFSGQPFGGVHANIVPYQSQISQGGLTNQSMGGSLTGEKPKNKGSHNYVRSSHDPDQGYERHLS